MQKRHFKYESCSFQARKCASIAIHFADGRIELRVYVLREEQRAMPAYEEPPVLPGGSFCCDNLPIFPPNSTHMEIFLGQNRVTERTLQEVLLLARPLEFWGFFVLEYVGTSFLLQFVGTDSKTAGISKGWQIPWILGFQEGRKHPVGTRFCYAKSSVLYLL